MRRRLLVLLALPAGLLLAVPSCTTVTTFEPEPFIYADRPPIRLAVDRIEVVNEHRPSGRPPFIEHTLAVPPALAATQLLQSRLAAAGSGGWARAAITEASIKREELPTRKGLAGAFTREPQASLTGRLQVRVEILAPDGEVIQSLTTGAGLRRTILEGASLAEQRKITHELVRDLVDDLDAGLETNIRQNFTRFLASPGRG